jgi:hypothetical protein
MKAWTSYIHNDPIPWLLEGHDPAITYAALVHLFEKQEQDPDVLEARQRIAHSTPIKTLLQHQAQDGYWGEPSQYLNARFTGTAWRILLALELGLDPKHPQVQHAAQFLLQAAYHKDLHGFVSRHNSSTIAPCYTGDLLWIFLQCGLYEHPYVQEAIQWVLQHMQFHDGVETVDNPDDGCFGRHTCIRAILPVLRAFSCLPDHGRTDDTIHLVDQCVEFLLIHHVYTRSHNLSKPMHSKMTQLTFPYFYYPDLLYSLFVLTTLGIHDERMHDAMTYLLNKQDRDGRWKMQRLYNERSKHDVFPAVVTIEERMKPSKWITLKALTVIKRFYEQEVDE